MTKSSDYVYSEPPAAPDSWNAGEVAEFDGGRLQASVYPPDADLNDGEVVKDAYVSFFDVSRSTRAVFSDTEEVLYVPMDGEVRGFVDYRIRGGAENEDVINHSVEVELVGEEGTVSENGGFSIPYEGLQDGSSDDPTPGTVSLTLRATFTATYIEDDEPVTEEITANDKVEVQPYNPALPPPIAVYGRHPNDDTSVFFLREGPWSSVAFDDGTTVHSNWRFFSARDTDWDRKLRFSTQRREGTTDQAYHPLQVHAYPSRSGVYVDGDAEVGNVLGDEYDPPSLSDGMNFDLSRGEYTATQGFELRYDGDVETGSIALKGIVRGTSVERPPFPNVQEIRTTDLNLSVTEVSDDAVEVKVTLRDSDGNPVDTRRDDGFVRVDGHGEVETGIDGTATVEISPPPSGAVVAEYVPVDWYEASTETTYVGDTDSINPNRDYGIFAELGMLSQLGVFLLPFLVSVYFLDRALGLGVWPPWRRI